jgi:hypothetical protein
MSSGPRATRNTYIGLLWVTMATVAYEVLLTRIFSVTLWYHFAFMAISVAMFGMTVGALAVYLRPDAFPPERLSSRLTLFSYLFSISAVLALTFHVVTPEPLTATYVAVAIPFAMSGVAVSLALTRFPEQLSALYAADLAGAAVGCVLVIPLLAITDGLTAAIAVAALGSVGAVFFASGGASRRLLAASVATALLLGVFAAVHTVMVREQRPWFRIIRAKGRPVYRPLYEKWNSFSRVTIQGPDTARAPIGWGMSSAWRSDRLVRQMYLIIDAMAGTVLTELDGDVSKLDYLKYDITNAAHHFRRDARVLVIGTGGGRDILSALVFGQKAVTGVEINENVLDTVNGRFGDFTGHLDRDPRVTFVNDEARSWMTRTRDRFDVIQVSLIDTWAATAAGAFVLSESSLYTVEAWKTFLARLEPPGILTFSRWYFRHRPGEVYRLTALASAALRGNGVDDPRGHIAILRRMYGEEGGDHPDGIGTILVGRSAFTEQDLDSLERLAQEMRFEVVLTPRFARDPVFERLASGRELEAAVSELPINVAPPTDDSPFFFHMLRLRDIFRPERQAQGTVTFNMEAVSTLGTLLITVVGLTLLCILVPLLLTADRSPLRGAAHRFVYFAGIGLGFMLVEISQMQRLVVFLGHPSYGLSVVLFTLLLSSGLGSWSTSRLAGSAPSASRALATLLALLVAFGFATPSLLQAFAASATPVRIAIAVAMLFPLGLAMGTAFPIGMRAAVARAPALAPWLWGINGATSVCASVLAVAVALTAGISASYWTGAACYTIAVSAHFFARR